MMRVLSVGVLLTLVSLSVFAGGYFVNDTGETVYGLRLEFSEPVTIASFGDVLSTVEPLGESTTFIFSGGTVEPWGDHWIIWESGSASIVSSEWLVDIDRSEAANEAGGGCFSPPPASLPYGSIPDVPSAVREVVYGYIEEVRLCQGNPNHLTPVYVSIPPCTPASDIFYLALADGASIPLTRIDETNLAGWITVSKLPNELALQVVRNSVPVGSAFPVALENAYQAITLALPHLDGVQTCLDLPDGFVKAAEPSDIWGGYSYGASGEWGSIHLRDYFEPTCQRLVDMGCSDVFVVDTIRLEAITPSPRISTVHEGGARTIEDSEMIQLAETAHKHNLRLHIQIFLGVANDSYLPYLQSRAKSASWLGQLLEEYREIAVQRARVAEQAGVDALTMNWQAAYTRFDGHEELWWSLWDDCIDAVRAVFSGDLEFAFESTEYMNHLLSGEAPLTAFDGIDAFLLLTAPGPRITSADDSLAAFYSEFALWLEGVGRFRDLVSRPMYLEILFQSTDGYFVEGWYDVAVGRYGGTVPDFFEQARAYEAILQAIARSHAVDGIVSFKYHWDDPFGPELGMNALARMDLSASVRNKPAEAVLKRWFGGTPGPSCMITSEQSVAMNRPWCPASSYEIDLQSSTGCTFLVDDFEGGTSLRDRGWQIDYDSSQQHNPGADVSSFCDISFPSASDGNGFLSADFQHSTWMKIRYWGSTIDVSAYEGIQLQVWGGRAMTFNLELAAMDPSRGWQTGNMSGLAIDTTPRTFRIPFEALVNPAAEQTGAFIPYLEHFMAIGVFMAASEGTIMIDDICFYSSADAVD